ncbi:hypothetical protein TSUD_79610 [Trifolium subterraneum]|uniref:LMBR1-like membrane protein n=1 Tax=Trifolium subterraneum TaxID=3900 RepID=A0A2Z6M9Z0_TRISU|nr:hypothetical protein TSUD_79610 [Trifolium subterraneum]
MGRRSWSEVEDDTILRLKVTATVIIDRFIEEEKKMWVFYLISLPLTVAMVIFTLKYFAAPSVPLYVLFTVGYTWFVSLSIIILVPADIWVTISSKLDNGGISFFWSWSYWRLSCPLFRVLKMLVTLLSGSILGFAMACSNTFGLVTGAFLLGFGLSEIPKNVWRNADWTTRQKVLSHKIAKMAVELDDAHQELSNAIVIPPAAYPDTRLSPTTMPVTSVFIWLTQQYWLNLVHDQGQQDAAPAVAQATSKHMSRRDPLRPYMDVIDDILTQMFREDPSFTPQGGRLGGSDMDYDTDEKSMATLRRHLRGATEEYYRYKSEYMTYVLEALELEDTTKNYERRHITGWKYMSSIRPARTGKLGSLFDTLEFFWRCILRKHVEKGLAVLLGIMSVAILLAEATLLPSVDLSLFSILIKSVGTKEMLVQRMGNIDNAVPFFGDKFNKIFPLIMVIYTILVASNFFDRVFEFLGSWRRYIFKTEAEDMDGFNPSGLIILQKERYWLEQGREVGEQVVPLSRNFSSIDVESSNNIMEENGVEMKGTPKIMKEETRRYNSSREAISSKYAAVRQQSGQASKLKAEERNLDSAKVSLLDKGDTHYGNTSGTSSLGSTWQTLKKGFTSFKADIGGAQGFLPIRQTRQDSSVSRVSSSESLDDIFQRLKKPSMDQSFYNNNSSR